MNELRGTATVTIDGATYRIDGPVRILRDLAENDERIVVTEPITWPVSVTLTLSDQAGRKLTQWMEKITAVYASPEEVQAEPRRRRAQWKDEQSRYGRKR